MGLKGVGVLILLGIGQTASTLPQVRFGLWQRTGYTRLHVPRSEGGQSGSSSGGETFCVTAANYKRMFDLEGPPADGRTGCVRSHERWKGNKYTASVDCKTDLGYDHIDVWVTIQDAEHVSIGESTGSLTDNTSSFGRDEATFISSSCGKDHSASR